MRENNRKENTEEERDAYITTKQKHRLILFVEQYYSGLFERSSIHPDELIKEKLWKAVTVQLNCIGPEKNESGWRKCFIWYKAATRLKLKEIEAKRVPAENLNQTDLRIIKMCRMDTNGIDLNSLLSHDIVNSYELAVPAYASKNNSGLLTQEIPSNNSITPNQQAVPVINSLKGIQTFQTIGEALASISNDQETYEEAKELEKRYSKHRDSNSFREAEVEKQNKRDHPVNSMESESNNLIDVSHMIAKIDQAKAANENKENKCESLPKNRQQSKIPKIIKKNRKRISGRITKGSNYQKTGTTNLKANIKTFLPLPVKPSSLQMKNQTKKTSETETFGGNKNDKIGETVDNVGKSDNRNEKVLTKTSKYHRNCTATHTITPGTVAVNLKKTIGIKKAQPLQFEKSIPLRMKTKMNKTRKTEVCEEAMEVENQNSRNKTNTEDIRSTFDLEDDNSLMRVEQISENDSVENESVIGENYNYPLPKQCKGSKSTATTKNKSGTAQKEFEFDFLPIKKTEPPKFIKSIPKNKTKKTSKTELSNGKTVGNVEKKLGATNTGSLSFDEYRNYVKEYHTRYMTNQDNAKDSSEERKKQNSSKKNQNPDENRPSDLAEGSLVKVGKRSKNDVNETGNKEKENDSLPKQSKRNASTKAHLTQYRKPANVSGGQWRVESVGKETREIQNNSLGDSEGNECIRKNYKRNGTAKSTDKNNLLPDKCVNYSRPKSIKRNHSREYVAQPAIKPASTTTDADFQSKVLTAVNKIQNFCVNSDRKRIAFEAKIQSNFDTFTRETLNRINLAPVRESVHPQIRAPLRAPVRATDRPAVRASVRPPVGASVRPPVRAPLKATFQAPFRAPFQVPFRAPFQAHFQAPVRAPTQFYGEEEMEQFDRNFKIKSKDTLEELEWALQSDLDVKRKLLYRFNEFGGKDEKAAIRLKMKYLVHDSVLDTYTWRGTTTEPPKDAFKMLININNLIFRSVRQQFPNYTRHEYDTYLVEWLKHSSSRQRTVIYQYPQRENMNDDENADQNDDEDGDQNDDEDGDQNDDEDDDHNDDEYGNDENHGDENLFDNEDDFFDE